MAKPILVTVPCLLLLLDFWPLGRMALSRRGGRRPRDMLKNLAWLVLEKIPLFALAGVSCAVTVWAQGEAIVPADHSPWPWRIGNALLSYVGYLGHFFYPVHLAVAYPRRDMHLPAAVAGPWGRGAYGRRDGGGRRRLAKTSLRDRRLALVPRNDAAGDWGHSIWRPEAEPDRFTYLPQIGIGIVLAWGAADCDPEMAVSRQDLRPGLGCGLAGVGGVRRVADFLLARQQDVVAPRPALHVGECHRPRQARPGPGRPGAVRRGHRRVSETALRINPNDAGVHGNLGVALGAWGGSTKPSPSSGRSLKIIPDDADGHGNLGMALAGVGRVDEAIAEYRSGARNRSQRRRGPRQPRRGPGRPGALDEAVAEYRAALRINPNDAEARGNLGVALAGHGQVDAAIAEYQEAAKINPHDAAVHRNLGLALASAGDLDEAAAEYRKALKIDPNEAVAHGALGMALAGLGRLDEAVAEYRKALKINPNDAIAYNKLAWIRATHPDPRFRDGAEAVTLARRAVNLARRSHGAGHAGRRLRRGGPVFRGRAVRGTSDPLGHDCRQSPPCRPGPPPPGTLQEGKALSSAGGPIRMKDKG